MHPNDFSYGLLTPGLGRVLAVNREPGEVVGERGEEAGLSGERFGVRGRLGHDDHLSVMGATTLQHRQGTSGGDVHDPPNSSSSSVHGAPAAWAAAYMSASARTVIIAASLGMSSTQVRQRTTARSVIARARLTATTGASTMCAPTASTVKIKTHHVVSSAGTVAGGMVAR